MTKYEYLRLSEPKESVFTWKALGELKATNNKKVYSKDNIYIVKTKASELFNCLIYCMSDIQEVYWTKAKILDETLGEITFGNNIVSAEFKLLLTQEEFESVDLVEDQDTKEAYKDFSPYKNIFERDTSKVIIDDEDYERIISVLGYPFITEEELEYTRAQITELAIRPALEEYFHWIPNVRPEVVTADGGEDGSTGGHYEYKKTRDTFVEKNKKYYLYNKSEDSYTLVKNPDSQYMDYYYESTGKWIAENKSTDTDGSTIVYMPSDAYGVVGLSLQQTGTNLGGNATSPLFYAIEQSLYGGLNYSSLTGSFTGNTPYTNTNSIGGMMTARAASQAILNYTRRVHYEGPYNPDKTHPDGKYIKVYSNISGAFNVWWAIRNLNFNDIEYANRRRVIEYAQACVKELFANVRGQAKSDIPGQYDYNQWKTEAKETKDAITQEWKALVKYSGIIRGSL